MNDWREAPDAIARFCADHGIARVHANAEWGLNERRRDEAVAAALGEADVEWTLHQGGTLLPPGSVLTGKGECYRVYTPYARACREAAQRAAGGSRRARPQTPPAWSADALPNRFDGFDPPSDAVRALWPAGEDAAGERLAGFVDEAIESYQGDRDFPSRPGTSCLSPYLAAGVLSARRCARRRRRTWASWTAARPASPPGSMNCCGASSTSTCWPPIPSCRCTGP